MADLCSDPFLLSRRLSLAAFLCFGAVTLTVSAQGYPGAGAGMGRHDGRAGPSIEERVRSARPAEPRLRLHVLELFAAGLEKESPAMNLSPAATRAMRDFIRDMKDFAALDDRHVRERLGWSLGTVHAAVDVQRDLADVADGTKETAGAAADVVARWKALQPLLDAAQRERVDAVYRGALSDVAAPPSQPAK